MFETQIPSANSPSQVETAELHRVDWAELVARLAASRDLRSVIARRSSPSAGNFARFGKVAASGINENKADVNPNILADGKYNGGNDLFSAGAAELGDRE